jgi:hypothetical protein
MAQGLLANFGNVSISLIGDELKTVGADPAAAGGIVWRRAK